MSDLSPALDPPYYAVIFTAVLKKGDEEYRVVAERMIHLAEKQSGFLGVDSVRGADGVGITVSYWESTDAIAKWKEHVEHKVAQERGLAEWYRCYELKIAKVERAYGFSSG